MHLSRPHHRALIATAVASVPVLLAACSPNAPVASNSASPVDRSSSMSRSSAPAVPAAAITSTPANGATNVDPVAPISVSAQHGRLTTLTMTNAAGTQVTGAMGTGDTAWHTTEVLGYGKTYTVHATAVNSAGRTTTKTISFTTLSPSSTVDAVLQRMGGYGLDNETYGVGIVPVVHFDAPIKDEAAVQKHLSVTASRSVKGVWSWRDNEDVAYRPESFWPANTKVTVTANVYGVNTGGGVYGAADESTSFTIGRRQLIVADDNSPQIDKVRVYNAAGQVLRTMDTSMGKHSGETIDGKYINFYTLNGTYTVLDHENPAIMSSQSYGLPANAPNGYGKLSVPYSTKISTDGIYLHQFNSTIYDQQHGLDVSEGCLNLQTSDAVWVYDHTIVGDPVVVHGAKGAPEIQPWEGGYWSEPWSTWVKDSATG